MSRARKTIDVATLRDWVNTALGSSDKGRRNELSPDQAWREGLASLLDLALHHTGNYQGFSYQDSERNPEWEPGGDVDWLRPGHDDTRRRYY